MSKSNPWVKVLAASVVLIGSSVLFHEMKPLSSQAQGNVQASPSYTDQALAPNQTPEQALNQAPESRRDFSLVPASASMSNRSEGSASATAVNNTDLPPCPTPAQKTTGILIEGDRPGETTGRKEKIEAVARQNNLQGKWCISAKTSNATWNMDGISVDEAVRSFNLFKEAGLVSLARPTDSATGGRVTWSPAEAGGLSQNVASQMPETSSVPENLSPTGEMGIPSEAGEPAFGQPGRMQPCPQSRFQAQGRHQGSSMMRRTPMPSGYGSSARI